MYESNNVHHQAADDQLSCLELCDLQELNMSVHIVFYAGTKECKTMLR